MVFRSLGTILTQLGDAMQITKKIYRKILVIPDLHAPWIDWKAVKYVKAWHDKHKPDLVIQLGDITDQKIWSRWQSDPDDFSPSQEFKKAAKDMNKLHEMFPKMIILSGNHDVRVKARAIEAGIPAEMFKDVNEVFDKKGWKWWPRDKRLIVNTQRGKILFIHGDEMGGTVAQKSRALGMSVVQGHTHKMSLTYTQTPTNHFFGCEAGHLLDVNSKAARYSQANPMGCSSGFVIIKYGLVMPITVDKKGRV